MEPPTLFTGAPVAERGDSLVAKHQARQREIAEAAACESLSRAAPGFPEELCRVALEGCDWDVDAARAQLLAFQASTRGDSDSDSRGRKRRRHKEKKSKEQGKRERKKSGRREREEREEAEEAELPPPRAAGAISESQFGRYGLIKAEDMWSKQPEFSCWLQEVKQRNPESLQKFEERELFAEFMEDHNTATLPHMKFYNLERWHAKEAAAAAREGGAAGSQEAFDFSTLEEARKRELAVERERVKDAGKPSLVEHMRLVGKLDGLREQQLLHKQLQLAQQVGDSQKVREIQAKLAPDDPRKSAAANNYGFRP